MTVGLCNGHVSLEGIGIADNLENIDLHRAPSS
jgi:hypothetical protein